MIQRVKDFLGIESVRLSLDLGPDCTLLSGELKGTIHLDSLRAQTVLGLELELTERYSRGRGKEQLIDSYTLGSMRVEHVLRVDANERVSVPFVLRFAERPNRLESYLKARPLLRPFGYLAKLGANTKSEYTLTASAKVEGVTLPPRASVQVDFS